MTAMIAVGMCVNFASCSGDSDAYLPERRASILGAELKLTSADTTTRGTDLTQQSVQIVAGQQVGVTTTGAKSGTNQTNAAWTAQQSGVLKNMGSAVYFGSGAITVKAYHPYNAAFTTSGVFSVNEDQSGEGYLNSDLLWATTTANESDETTKLSFKHKLAKINVTLTSSTITDLSNAVVSICGTYTSTTFDPSTGNISGANNMKIIKAATTTSTGTATAIVIPQTVPNKTSLVRVVLGNKSYYYNLSADKTLSAGYSYSFTLALKDDSEDMDEVSSSIDEWTDEKSSGNALANELSIGTAGTLSQYISEEDKNTLTSIKVSGNLNSDDLSVLKSMTGVNDGTSVVGQLAAIDLSGATLENNTLPNNCFSGSHALSSIILPETLVTIGSNAITEMKITSLVIPASVTTIGTSAFAANFSLQEVHFKAISPITTPNGATQFAACTSSFIIYVPNSVLSEYQTAWSEYSSQIQGE